MLAIARTLGALGDLIITYTIEYRSTTITTSGNSIFNMHCLIWKIIVFMPHVLYSLPSNAIEYIDVPDMFDTSMPATVVLLQSSSGLNFNVDILESAFLEVGAMFVATIMDVKVLPGIQIATFT